MQMNINGSETNTVRLFHLDLPPEAIERYTTMAGTGEWPLKYGLGAQALRPAFVDVVDLRDLESMALSRYLSEAHGAAGADFESARPQIDALRGHVLILPSQAFDNTSQTLNIAAPLRWVGTFSETPPRPKGAKLRSASARGAAGGGASGLPGMLSTSLKLILLFVAGVVAIALARIFIP